MNKINVLPVVARHLETLSDYGEDKRSWSDYLLFIVLPIMCGIGLAWTGFGFRTDAVNGFLNAFSIFTGLLLNVLILVFTLTGSTSPLNVDVRLRRELLRQVFVNICFTILVSIVVVCAAIIALSYMRSEPGARTGPVATAVLASFTLNFVLTLLMVIKRMFALLDKELERTNPQRKNAA
jgi:hypothetical protein